MLSAEANVARWREKGNAIWMYVACDTQHPYPNIFIDYPLIDCRVLPWIYWHYGIECFLYWSANWFGEENMRGADPAEKWPQRPWVAGNFVENWRGKQNVYNGDGQLIYPGPGGTALSSIRLEALRDGLEDYEYLWLLRKGVRMLEAAEVEPELCAEAKSWLEQQSVVTSFTEWCAEPEELRRRLARICITQLSAGSSTVPGGYGDCRATELGEQFPVCDQRTAAEVAAELESEGFAVRWDVG